MLAWASPSAPGSCAAGDHARVMTTPSDVVNEGPSRVRVLTLRGACTLAAAVLVFRSLRSLLEGWPPAGVDVAGAAVALLAAGLAVLAIVIARRDMRRAGIPLAWALLLELVVLPDLAAPPRFVTALPLVLALAVAVVPEFAERDSDPVTLKAPVQRGADSWPKSVATVLAFILLLPVGFAYLSTGLVAPAPDLFGVYLIFGFFVVGAVRLATRRSWWVLAVPFVAAGVWLLVIWLGEGFLGWTA